MEEILELTKKWKDFNQVTFDGLLLEDEKIEDMSISNEDILIAELQKDDKWVLQLKQETKIKNTETIGSPTYGKSEIISVD